MRMPLKNFWDNTDALGVIGGLFSTYALEILGNSLTGICGGIVVIIISWLSDVATGLLSAAGGGIVVTIISWLSDVATGVLTAAGGGIVVTCISWLSDAATGVLTGVGASLIGAGTATLVGVIESTWNLWTTIEPLLIGAFNLVASFFMGPI